MRRSRHRPPKWKPHADFVYVDVERLTGGTPSDSFGESNPTWTKLYSNMPCHLESVERPTNFSNLPMTEAGLLSESEMLLVFEAQYNVKARDRILDYDGNYYRVTDVSPFATHKQALLTAKEID